MLRKWVIWWTGPTGLVEIRGVGVEIAGGCGGQTVDSWSAGRREVAVVPGHRTPFRSTVLYVARFWRIPAGRIQAVERRHAARAGFLSELGRGSRRRRRGQIPRLTLARRIAGRKPARTRPPYSWARYRARSSFGAPWKELLGLSRGSLSHAHSSQDW